MFQKKKKKRKPKFNRIFLICLSDCLKTITSLDTDLSFKNQRHAFASATHTYDVNHTKIQITFNESNFHLEAVRHRSVVVVIIVAVAVCVH